MSRLKLVKSILDFATFLLGQPFNNAEFCFFFYLFEQILEKLPIFPSIGHFLVVNFYISVIPLELLCIRVSKYKRIR